jgi:hypothetical protein
MKKLITLLLLFTITLFYSIPTQAYTTPLNNGVSDNEQAFVQTKNLFDKDTILLKTLINILTGALVQEVNVGWETSDKIPVLQNTSYTLQGYFVVATGLRIGFYQNDDTFISATNPGGTATHTFTTPLNTGYIRISYRNTPSQPVGNLQLEQGNSPTSFTSYGFLSLNNIFKNGNLLNNPYFDNGTFGWNLTNATGNVSNNIYTFTPTVQFGNLAQTLSITNNNGYYISSTVKSSSNLTDVSIAGLGSITHSGSNEYEVLSSKFTWTAATALWPYRIRNSALSGFTPININGNFGNYAINLTSLGIDHLSKLTLDNLLKDFQFNNLYNQGVLDGYADGLQNNTAYVQGYNVGYTDGLFGGTDMETGSSLLILIVALIGFVMMIFGFTTKRGIFNLLSVGAFVVLGTLLVQFVGFVIIAIGLVLINIYYAFFGDL